MKKYDIQTILSQLTKAWKYGFSDKDACVLAGIDYDELLEMCEDYPIIKDAHDNFTANKNGDRWEIEQKIKARQNIQDKLEEGDPKMAKFVAEKLDDKFKPTSRLDINQIEDNTEERELELDKMLKEMVPKGKMDELQ